MQEGGVISYASCKLKNHEIDYVTHDLELDTTVMDMKLLIHYLMRHHFEIKIDHKSLEHIFTHKDLNA
jgi:hypothetical protein